MPKKLLIADDSVTIQHVVRLTFEGEDLEIEAVGNGTLAIERARAMRPDIVLADVFMPGNSGYEVCAAIKADPAIKNTPVVLLVGTFEPFDPAEAERVECDGYLTKPFDTEELIQTVRTLMEEKEAADRRRPSVAEEKSLAAEPAPQPERAAAAPALVSSRTRESFLGSERILDLFSPSAANLCPTAADSGTSGGLHVNAEGPQGREARDADSGAEKGVPGIPNEVLNSFVERVVREMAPDIVREVAWEVVPELSEIIIRQILARQELQKKDPAEDG